MAGDRKRRFETVRLPAKVASDQNKSNNNKLLAKYSENKSSSDYAFVIAAGPDEPVLMLALAKTFQPPRSRPLRPPAEREAPPNGDRDNRPADPVKQANIFTGPAGLDCTRTGAPTDARLTA
jgi:hypothetical protein